MGTIVRLSGMIGLLGLLACVSACSSGKATVTGKITYQGKSVHSGGISGVGPDGLAVPGSIQAGQYTISGITAGKVKIGVSSPPPHLASVNPGAGRGSVPKAAPAQEKDPNWFPIPDKFGDPEKSGVVIQVSSGANVIDLQLK